PSPHTIAPLSPLPAITNSMTIDATTQPGYSSAPSVELDGEFAGAVANGLSVTGGTVTIRGFVINRFAIMGIYLQGGTGHHVEANYIGTDVTGTLARGNGVDGVAIANSIDNMIGGISP